MMLIIDRLQGWLDLTRKVDFLGPLALRLYLVPVFWVAGTNKLDGMDNVIAWFGNPDWGLGLPFPALMAQNIEFPPSISRRNPRTNPPIWLFTETLMTRSVSWS